MNVSALEVAEVPAFVVTVTLTGPTVLPAGSVAMMEVAERTVKAVAGNEPNATAVAPVRFVPVMVTGVPPVAGPASGLTPEMMGTGEEDCVRSTSFPPSPR